MTKEDALFFLARFRTKGINEKLYDALGVAIEALNAQPSAADTNVVTTDTISRQAAIDALAEWHDAAITNRLNNLPSAQRWIPCSERLPEDYTDVLVWFEYYRYGDYNRLYQMHGIGDYMSEYDSWMINHETGWRKLRVFAWMPLPEPYKEEQP